MIKNRKKVVLIFIFVFNVCYSTANEGELFSRGLKSIQEKQIDQSIAIFNQLVKQSPEKSIYWFNLGNSYYMKEKFEFAIRSYRKVIEINKTLVPAAQWYLAKSLIKIGQHKEAQNTLENLNPQTPAGIKAAAEYELEKLSDQADIEEKAVAEYQAGNYPKAEQLLQNPRTETLSVDGRILLSLVKIKNNNLSESRKLLEQTAKLPYLSVENKADISILLRKSKMETPEAKPLWLFLDLSYGTTSNVYFEGKNLAPLSSPVLKYGVGVGYHLDPEQTWSSKISYNYNKDEYLAAPSMNTSTHNLQTTMHFEKNNLDASAGPYVQADYWESSKVSEKIGGIFKMNYTGNYYDGGLSYDDSYQKSTNSNYTYLSGRTNLFKIFFGAWLEKTYYQINYQAGYDGTQDIIYTDGSVLPLQHSSSGTGFKFLTKISKALSFVINLNIIQKKYKNVSLPSNKERSDTETNLFFKLNYSLHPTLQLFTSLEFLTNKSSLGATDLKDKNFDSQSFYLGFTWDIL